MLYKVIFLLAISGMALAGPFGECDQGAKPIEIKVDNCNEEYCEVHRGKASSMKMTFKTESKAEKLKASLQAQVAGIWINWSLGKQANVCNHLANGKCPVEANNAVIYSVDVTIPSIAPAGTRTTIKLKIADQDNKIVSCVQFPVLVVA